MMKFEHILVATDGSPAAEKAVALALRLSEGGSTRVSALRVVPDYGTPEFAAATLLNGPDIDELRRRLAAEGRRLLDQDLQRHGDHAAAVQRLVAVSDDPYEAIVDTARRERCDLIVMAPRGRGRLSAALLGSQTQRVLAISPVPVLVAPSA